MADVAIEKSGLKTVALGATPTPIAAGAPCEWHANRHGVPFVIAGHPNTELLDDEQSTAATFTLKTVNANERFVVTGIVLYLDPWVSTDVTVTVLTVGNTILKLPNLRAGGPPIVWGNGTGILHVGADAADLQWTLGTATAGGTATISVCGHLETQS